MGGGGGEFAQGMNGEVNCMGREGGDRPKYIFSKATGAISSDNCLAGIRTIQSIGPSL